jgi:hypothetical protein
MDTSEQIDALAGALSKAQAKITGALKDSANPFFKSKYADLASVWDACREQLSANGLAVIQTTDIDPDGVTVITTLAHSSGQWIRGRLRMIPVKHDPQGIGSCLTYARRYALAAIVGVAQVDDDANQASGKAYASPHTPIGDVEPTNEHKEYATLFTLATAKPEQVRELHAEIHAKGEEFYRNVWSLMDSKARTAIKKVLAETKVAA